jgi:hypothetical protein
MAWGASVQHRHNTSDYYLTEIDQTLDIPWMVGLFVEDKNVMGMTARFSVVNIFNGRHTEDRTVWNGYRDRTAVAFIERHDELVGPIFDFSLKGNF